MSETALQADGRTGRVAAVYARVSSERQRQDETIRSQTVGLRELATARGLLVSEDLVFEDEGFSGASLQRPALERLRDRAAEGAFEVLLCHAPDRLARRYAYQVLLLDEFARAGVEVCFAKEPERGGTPEDELLRQFQGMIAEYERAQIAERTRRGKAHRARTEIRPHRLGDRCAQRQPTRVRALPQPDDQRRRQPDGEHRGALRHGHAIRPLPRRVHIPPRLALRQAVLGLQRPDRVRRRQVGHQLDRPVDPDRVLVGVSSTQRHQSEKYYTSRRLLPADRRIDRSNSKFAIAWEQSSRRACATSICTGLTGGGPSAGTGLSFVSRTICW